jgi:hypothetical protein
VKREWLLASRTTRRWRATALVTTTASRSVSRRRHPRARRRPGPAPPCSREPAGGGVGGRAPNVRARLLHPNAAAACRVRRAPGMVSLVPRGRRGLTRRGRNGAMARSFGRTLWQVVRGRNPYWTAGRGRVRGREGRRQLMSNARLALIRSPSRWRSRASRARCSLSTACPSQDAYAYFNFARAIGPHLRHGAPLPDLFWPRGYPVAVARCSRSPRWPGAGSWSARSPARARPPRRSCSCARSPTAGGRREVVSRRVDGGRAGRCVLGRHHPL